MYKILIIQDAKEINIIFIIVTKAIKIVFTIVIVQIHNNNYGLCLS